MNRIHPCSLLACLALTSRAGAHELATMWSTVQSATAPVADIGFGADARSTQVLTVKRQPHLDTETVLVLDALGAVTWSRTSTPSGQAGILDVAFSTDGSLALVLRYNPPSVFGSPTGELVVDAFAADTGVVAWSEPVSPPEFGFDALQGWLCVAGGVVAVQQTGTPEFGPPESNLVVLDDTTGAFASESAAQFLEFRGTAASPNGDRFYSWAADGLIEAISAATGATLWMTTVPTASSVTDLAVSGDGSYLLRADGLEVAGVDSNTGALVWQQPGVESRSVAPYASDRVFAAGVVGTGGPGGVHSYGMLDSATGAILWSATSPTISNATSALSVKRVHTASDLTNGLVAFRDLGLFVFDATNGASIGSLELASVAGVAGGLISAGGSGWVAHHGAASASTGVLLGASTPTAIPAWSLDGIANLDVAAQPVWIAGDESAGVVHSIYEDAVSSGALVSETTFYQRRDLETGDLLSEWGMSKPYSGNNSAFALDPSGTRLARVTSAISATATIDILDPTTGDVIGTSTTSGSLEPKELLWSDDGSRLFTAWYRDSLARVTAVDSSGQQLWSQVFDVGFQSSWDTAPVLAPLAGGAQLLLATEDVDFPSDTVAVFARLDATTGQALGNSSAWIAPGSDSRRASTQSLHVDESTGHAFAVVETTRSSVPDEIASVLSIDLTNLAIVGDRTLVGPNSNVKYRRASSAMTSGANHLLVAGRGQSLNELRVTCLQLPSLAVQWERTDVQSASIDAAQVLLSSDRVGCIRVTLEPGFGNALQLFDMEEGVQLANEPAGITIAETDEQHTRFTHAGRNLLLAGVFDGPSPAPSSSVQRVDHGALLSDPSTLSNGPVTFVLDADDNNAGKLYLVLGGASGTAPPFPIDLIDLPLVPDFYTNVTLFNANKGAFEDTFGALDAQGTARAVIAVPAQVPALQGLTLHHAALAWTPGGLVDFTSGAVSLTVQ